MVASGVEQVSDVLVEAARLVAEGEVARGVALLRSAAGAKADRGDVDAAIELLNRIRRLDALTSDDSFALAGLYRKKGHYRAAEAELRTMLGHTSNDVDALRQLAEVCVLQQDFRTAIMHLERLLSVDRVIRGEDLKLLADIHQTLANEHRLKALRIFRDLARQWADADPDSGLRYWRQVLALTPDDTESRDHIARLEAHLDDEEQRLQRAVVYRSQGRLSEAEAELRHILRHHLNHVQALWLLSQVLFEQGNHRFASIQVQKLLAVDPTHEAGQALLRQVGAVDNP